MWAHSSEWFSPWSTGPFLLGMLDRILWRNMWHRKLLISREPESQRDRGWSPCPQIPFKGIVLQIYPSPTRLYLLKVSVPPITATSCDQPFYSWAIEDSSLSIWKTTPNPPRLATCSVCCFRSDCHLYTFHLCLLSTHTAVCWQELGLLDLFPSPWHILHTSQWITINFVWLNKWMNIPGVDTLKYNKFQG